MLFGISMKRASDFKHVSMKKSEKKKLAKNILFPVQKKAKKVAKTVRKPKEELPF